jgi:hypothetical protein
LKILLIIIGLNFINMAYLSYLKRKKFTQKGIVTKGKVVKIVGKPPLLQPKSTHLYYYPVIEFEHNGEKITFQSNQSSTDCPYEIGQEIDVRYLNEKTQIAEIEGFELETDVPEKEKVRHVSIGMALIIIAIIF